MEQLISRTLETNYKTHFLFACLATLLAYESYPSPALFAKEI